MDGPVARLRTDIPKTRDIRAVSLQPYSGYASVEVFVRIFLLILAFSQIGASRVSPADPQEVVRPDPRTPYFELRSDLGVGDHGEELLDVSYRGPSCGTQWRFDHAEIELVSNRFGDVQFVGLPQAGCAECEPVRIRWMHEPTGHLEFRINVFRRPVSVPCAEE